MEPVSPIFPTDIPPEHMEGKKLVLIFTPLGPDQIFAPGFGGGRSYAPISYSPQTGLLYVNVIDQPRDSGRGPKGYFSAYDLATGELAWRQIFEGYGQAGSVVTAGGLVFVGTGSNIAGYFFAFDAETGELLWKSNTRSDDSSPEPCVSGSAWGARRTSPNGCDREAVAQQGQDPARCSLHQ